MRIIFPGVNQVTYDLYSRHYRPIFDVKYHLELPLAIHPFMQHDQNLVFAFDQEHYVGGANILFLTEAFFEGIKTGEIIDDMILSVEDVTPISESERLNLYVSSIYVVEPYRKQGVASLLLKEIEDFAMRQSVKEKHLMALCLTDMSVQLFKKQGYEYHRKNSNGDHILYKKLL